MTKDRLYFGQEGEKAAVKFLKKRGYRIVEKNYRHKAGEIDIIAEHGQVLVFVEVKSRAGAELGEPLEAITPHKQRKIGQVARGFLTQHKIEKRDCRFDVVGIQGDPNQAKRWDIELIQDAFRL